MSRFPSRWDHLILFAVMAVCFGWRIPLMFRLCPGQDEDFYSVPGMTILETGLPQIPYIPSRDPASIYYHADTALFTLPPAGFYLQAIVHLLAGNGIGQARLASTIEALVVVFIAFSLAGKYFGRFAGFSTAVCLLLARAFYFPAVTARPDMAATMFGILALATLLPRRRRCGGENDFAETADSSSEPERRTGVSRRIRRCLIAGTLAGLGLLAHPMGIVAIAQGVGYLVIFANNTRRDRSVNVAAYLAAAAGAVSLWLPLIARYPALFWKQFGGNVLSRSGPGIGSTLLNPNGVVQHHIAQLLEHVGWFQLLVCLAGVAGLALALRHRRLGARELFYLAISSWIFLILFMGTHTAKGYYALPVVFCSIGVGGLLQRVAGAVKTTGWRRRIWAAVLICLIAAAHLPGLGLRTFVQHLRRWDDPAYNAARLADQMMQDIPEDELVAVDGYFVLYFYLRGRPAVDAITYRFYFDAAKEPFRYAVLGKIGEQQARADLPDLIALKTYGDPESHFGQSATLYIRSPAGAAPVVD